MAESESTRQRVDKLLRRHPAAADGGGAVGALGRLCHVAYLDLGLLGSAVTLVPRADAHTVSAVSSVAMRRLEEAQFGMGEGPTGVAFTARRPVLVADLATEGPSRWPGWAPIALSAGVCAVYALPLHVGATIFGVLTLYLDRAATLEGQRLETALVYSDIATEILLDGAMPGDGPELDQALHAAMDTHSHVYQAQGMVMVDLGVGLPEALARMRAHAWTTGQGLTALAGEIVAGQVRLPRDDH